MLDSAFACLFEKYGSHLSQKCFGLVASFKFSKCSFLCFLLSLTTKLLCYLYLDKSAGNWDLLAFFFSRERFRMAAVNDLFKCGFWLPWKACFFGSLLIQHIYKIILKGTKIHIIVMKFRQQFWLKTIKFKIFVVPVY